MASYRIAAADDLPIAMDLYRRGPAHEAVLVICPGFFQSKGTPTFRRLSWALSEDYDVLTMDFRGHGHSGGRFTFSAHEGRDLEAVLDWAAARYQRIGVLGFSLGGAVAITALARRPGLAQVLVAVSAPSTFEEIEFRFWTLPALRSGLRGLELGSGCRLGNPLLPKERPGEAIRKLAGLPVLLIHGTADVIVGAGHSYRLYEAAGDPKRLLIVRGGSHAEALFRDQPRQFLANVRPWLAEYLGPV